MIFPNIFYFCCTLLDLESSFKKLAFLYLCTHKIRMQSVALSWQNANSTIFKDNKTKVVHFFVQIYYNCLIFFINSVIIWSFKKSRTYNRKKLGQSKWNLKKNIIILLLFKWNMQIVQNKKKDQVRYIGYLCKFQKRICTCTLV